VFIRVHLSKERLTSANILRMQHALFERQKIWRALLSTISTVGI